MRPTNITKIAGVAAAIAALMFAINSGASAAAGDSYLNRGDSLLRPLDIHRLDSSGHLMFLKMQWDGNLVEYIASDSQDSGPWKACWASGTYGSGGTHADYQYDGNFVVYTDSGTPVWASNTQWGSGSSVDINSQGVIYVGTTPISGSCQW
ncbi:hypothetical protein ACH47Z_36035 [Streptomyces sp. NPDC020192]|uniref:hypothetical protein n=1 Tax=Streptomyces sp. NPDC020192 TaxID=3365066 RepID=UPI0037A4D7DF